MEINLVNCLPAGADGTRSLLPKQQAFLSSVLDPKAAKYTLYCGGIGSGKTIIGCLTMLCMAVTWPGDYLVCRQFFPELKITTLKTFLEICPKELIAEHRVADGIVKIKSQGGKLSNIIFRQLEEPDKLRSLNLSGFYIDESSQVSEAAFLLLQGRLRGNGPRKGFLTSNPNGHDWQYSWFVKQDMFKNPEARKQFKLIKAPSTENTHLPEGYVASMLETWSEERIQREIMGSFDAFEGQVYHEFRRDVHVIKPFAIPEQWTKVIGLDHGYRNPAAALWGAVDYDGNIYVYREFYEREWLISELVNGKPKENRLGISQLCKGEKIEAIYIDPSTRNRRGTTGLSDYDEYVEQLPGGMTLALAKNDKTSGIDRVKRYLKLNPKTNKPQLYIFDTCLNTIDEMARYRYAEVPANMQNKASEKEEPLKVHDHAMDALRYLVMSRPETHTEVEDFYKKVPYESLEGSLHRFLEQAKGKSNRNPIDDL